MNFQTKNAVIPIKATPPATDKPMIEPVPKLESEDDGGGRDDGEGEVLLDAARPKEVTTTVEPLMITVLETAPTADENSVVVVLLWDDPALESEDEEEVELEVEVVVEVVVVVVVDELLDELRLVEVDDPAGGDGKA